MSIIIYTILKMYYDVDIKYTGEHMTLSEKVGSKFVNKLEELFQKEKVDKDFLSQENYNSCFERAMDWIQMAFDDTKKEMATDAALPIAVHREDDHKDNTIDEQANLLEAGADPEMGAKSWWNQS